MNKRQTIFRVLFFLVVAYHIWVLTSFGGDYIVYNSRLNLFLFIIVNGLNLAVQFVPLIWFAYEGFFKPNITRTNRR